MRIHCLGTTGYHPNEYRQTSCYFLPAEGVVLDAGTGLFRLPRLIETDSLDILLSHAHLDHIVGLTYLYDVIAQRRVEPIRIWGEQAKLDAIRRHLFHELLFPVEIPVSWNSIDPDGHFSPGASGRLQVDSRRQQHPGGSLGYRLRWPGSPHKTLVYATDTIGDLSAEALRWMRGADLLMHECYFEDAQQQWATKTGHCWTSRAAEVARQAEVKRLLLTHLNPLADGMPLDEWSRLRALFPAAAVAHDGDVIDF